MKKHIFFLLILTSHFSIINCLAQEYYLWPIEGVETGQNILYKPNEYIGTEHNFGNLFLTAPEGMNILAPTDGIVSDYRYTYHTNLIFTYGFGEFSGDFESDQKSFLERQGGLVQKKDIKFVSICIGITTSDKKQIWINGLYPVKNIKSGMKIKKGDVIGTMGYSYKAIPQPSICLSISEKTLPSDPMTPFGLKSTFKKPEPKIQKTTLTAEEAKQDFELLVSALKEWHPGIYDYISEQKFEKYVSNTLLSINSPLSLFDFEKIVLETVSKIRDSHTWVVSQSHSSIDPYRPTVCFGWLNDTLIVTRALETEKHYYRKKITAVDGIPADSLRRMVEPYLRGSEGFIESYTDFTLFYSAYLTYFQYAPDASRKCDVTLTFEDGTSKFFKGVKYVGKDMGLYPQRQDLLNFLNINQNEDENVVLEKLSDDIAYIGLGSFNLNQVETEQFNDFFKSIADSCCPNLIIDVRNNPGGNDVFCTQIFSYLAKRPFQKSEYVKVNKQSDYKFIEYCLNYGQEQISFPDYTPVDGKEGFYYIDNELHYPDSLINYKGRVYILTNERSFSASSLLAGLVYKYKRGAIAGRETGTAYYQMNAMTSPTLRLPSSSIDIAIPLVKFVFTNQIDERIPWGRGILPDYPVSFTLEEIAFENGDSILKYTLQLIQDGLYIDEPLTSEDSDTVTNGWAKYLYIVLIVMAVVLLFWMVYRKMVTHVSFKI